MLMSNEQVLNKIMDLVSKGYSVQFRPDYTEGSVQVRLHKDNFTYCHIFEVNDKLYAEFDLEDRVEYIIGVAEEEFEYHMKQKEDT